MPDNLVIVGTSLFLLVVAAFVLLRRVNRFLIVLLSASFLLYSAASILSAVNAFYAGVAPWPRGRYDLATVSLQQSPGAYWLSCAFLWILAAGFAFAGLRFLAISLRRSRNGL
jgi:pilus assembly protein TadC